MQEKLTLGGDGGGIFDVESRGAATLAATRMVTLGPPAAQVTDALAGRSTDAAVFRGLSARSSTALLRMADFFNSTCTTSPPDTSPPPLTPGTHSGGCARTTPEGAGICLPSWTAPEPGAHRRWAAAAD